MDRLTIKRQVSVKVRVTEEFKNTMAADIQKAIKKLDLELQNIDFQIKRATAEIGKSKQNDMSETKKRFETEKSKRNKAREQLMEQLRQVGRLPIGSEVHQGNLDTITEIKVGDKWEDIFGVEVIVCDNQIVEIRKKSSGDIINEIE